MSLRRRFAPSVPSPSPLPAPPHPPTPAPSPPTRKKEHSSALVASSTPTRPQLAGAVRCCASSTQSMCASGWSLLQRARWPPLPHLHRDRGRLHPHPHLHRDCAGARCRVGRRCADRNPHGGRADHRRAGAAVMVACCMLHGCMLHGCMLHVAWLHVGCMVACCMVACCMLHGCMVACCAVSRKVRGALFASCVAYRIVWGKYSLVRVRWGSPSITFACGCKTDGTRGIRHTAHTWRAAHNAHVAQHVALGVRVRPRLQLLEESTRNKCKFQRGKVSSHVRRTG